MASAPPTDFDPAWAAEDKGPAIIGVIVAVTILETLFSGARLYVRGRIMGKLHLDDYLIVLAVRNPQSLTLQRICGWCAVIFGIMAVHSGNGKHFAILDADQKSGAILWTIVGFCPGIMSFGLPKLAVVALLTRLLNPSRAHRIFLWGIAILCNLSLLGCVVVLFAQCTPAKSQWDFSITEKTCWSPWILVHYAIFAGAMSAATDLYLAVYPAIVLFNLQLKLRKKLALTAALSIGSIATVIAIYKTTRLPNLASQDFSFDTSDLVIWTCVEGSAIIIASCIPILQPLADKILGSRFFGSTNDRRAYKKYGSERSGAMRSDMELSSHKNRTTGAVGGRSAKDPNSLTFLDKTKASSEESILNQDAGRKPAAEVVVDPAALHPADMAGRIVRTDVVTVSHSARRGQSEEDVEGWKSYGY